MSKKEQSICHYWHMADSIRRTIKTQFPTPLRDGEVLDGVLLDLNRLCIWYAFLYVLVEGYMEMRGEYHSEAVEVLLTDYDRVDRLRVFRNAVFHFQDQPYHDKMLSFMKSHEVETWAGSLHEAMRLFCESVFPGFEKLAEARISIKLS